MESISIIHNFIELNLFPICSSISFHILKNGNIKLDFHKYKLNNAGISRLARIYKIDEQENYNCSKYYYKSSDNEENQLHFNTFIVQLFVIIRFYDFMELIMQ